MFHQDELVRNYLVQASQRYAELRTLHRRQSDELDQLMSPGVRMSEPHAPSTRGTAEVPRRLATFERKNTLLLTGKSKFYTMSYEDHCRTPSPSGNRTSTPAGLYHTDNDLTVDRFDDMVEIAPTRGNVWESKSSDVTFPCNHTTSSGETTTLFREVHRYTEGPRSDTNHNSIFWPTQTHCLGVKNCPHPVLPHTGNLCAACYQAKRYSSVVQYPTATTKM